MSDPKHSCQLGAESVPEVGHVERAYHTASHPSIAQEMMRGRVHHSAIIPIHAHLAADTLSIFNPNPFGFFGVRKICMVHHSQQDYRRILGPCDQALFADSRARRAESTMPEFRRLAAGENHESEEWLRCSRAIQPLQHTRLLQPDLARSRPHHGLVVAASAAEAASQFVK